MVSYNTLGHKPEKYIQDEVSIKPKWSGIWNRRRNLIHSYNVVRAHDFHPVSIAACYSHGARIATPAPPGHSHGSSDPSPGQLSWPGPAMWQAPGAAVRRQHSSLAPAQPHSPTSVADASTQPGNFRAQSDQLSICIFPFWVMFIFNLPGEPLSVCPQRWYLQETTRQGADCLGFLHPANSLLMEKLYFSNL